MDTGMEGEKRIMSGRGWREVLARFAVCARPALEYCPGRRSRERRLEVTLLPRAAWRRGPPPARRVSLGGGRTVISPLPRARGKSGALLCFVPPLLCSAPSPRPSPPRGLGFRARLPAGGASDAETRLSPAAAAVDLGAPCRPALRLGSAPHGLRLARPIAALPGCD